MINNKCEKFMKSL